MQARQNDFIEWNSSNDGLQTESVNVKFCAYVSTSPAYELQLFDTVTYTIIIHNMVKGSDDLAYLV